MSFGFLGIQFGWGLPMANMSAIEYLRPRANQLQFSGWQRPLTQLIAQPIIGRPRDRTGWGAAISTFSPERF